MVPAPADRPAPSWRQRLQPWLLPVLAVAIPSALAIVWGLSWAWADYPECGGGSYFLADLGWVFEGIGLGLLTGIVVPAVVMAGRGWLVALMVLVVTGMVMSSVADAAATHAALSVGCDPFYVQEAGMGILMGLGLGAVPTMVIGGIVVVVRRPTTGPGPGPGWGLTGR